MNIQNQRANHLASIFLCAITVAAFWPVLRAGFICYDDPEYVTGNAMVCKGLSWQGLVWAFTTFHASNWHPLTWLSHMLDCQLFGLNSIGHHLTNLLLHTANVLLLFRLLLALQQGPRVSPETQKSKLESGAFWRSASVASLFALHPLHVESVAWISERKDVLSGCFFMLTLLAYARYAQGVKERGKRRKERDTPEQQEAARPSSNFNLPSSLFYVLALLCFALGLMSKPMLVTTPFVLLLLDYWPLGRLKVEGCTLKERRRRSPGPGAGGGSEFNVQCSMSNVDDSQGSRIDPRTVVRGPGSVVFEKLPFFALSAVSCIVTFVAQTRGGAVESLQHVPLDDRLANSLVGYMAYLQKLVWPANLTILYLRPDQWPVWQVAAAVLLVAGLSLLVLSAGLVRPRPRPRNPIRRTESEDVDVDEERTTGTLAPSRGWLTVGWLWFLGMLVPVIGLVQVGDQFMADRYTYLPLIGCFIILVWCAWEFQRRLREKFKIILSFFILLLLAAAGSLTFRQAGFWKSTESLLGHCLVVTSDNYVAHNILGVFLAGQHRFEEARTQFLTALRIQPAYADGLCNLAVLLAEHGDAEQASDYLERAVSIRPDLARYYGKLGFVLDTQGRIEQAVSFYREALRLRPDDQEALNNLAWILATHPDPKVRNGAEAVGIARHACDLTGYGKAVLVGTLAAAYAEAGRFSEAVITAEKAVALANADGQKDLAQKNRRLLELYKAQKPYHEPQSNFRGNQPATDINPQNSRL